MAVTPDDGFGRSGPHSETATKLTLFCAACGHRSPVDGDWVLRPRGPVDVAYYCPRCAKTITVRPRDDVRAAGEIRLREE